MAQSVKLSDDVMTYVRRESELQSRSVAGQIAHWVRIGRAIEKSKGFDFQRIVRTLEAEISPDELTADEQEVWFDQFSSRMTQASPGEKAFHAKRAKLGRGVGMTVSGELVYQSDLKK